MAISQKSIKILWAAAGGRCSYPDCWERLCFSDAGALAPYTLGEMAHICGKNPGSSRYEPTQTDIERDDYCNLILLCPTHHTLIDVPENELFYTVEKLNGFKTKHQAVVNSRLDLAKESEFIEIVRLIAVLLADNKQAWMNYGPESDLARREPQNEAAHAVWLSERLSTIVPNNRSILRLLECHRTDFSNMETTAIAAFKLHARSYENWVRNEIAYSAVLRFPIEFERMIDRVANAS